MADSGPPAADRYGRFPDPVYKETVLRPLFDGAKTHFVDGFRAIDRAHLVMLAEKEIVSRGDARAIAGALEAIDREVDVGSLEYTGEVEDFFFLVESELKKRLGPDVAGRLHTGRSRNDIDHTLFRLKLKTEIDALAAKVRRLIGTLIDVAEREAGTIILAYTHGQPAQPSTFGHYLSAVVEVMLRDAERLAEARRTVDLSPMGAAAITTSGFPLDRARVAELLGFAAPTGNSYGSIATVDYITAPYSAIELIFLHLGRPIQDLQFWTSFEVGQIHVPNAFVQISSIMPQKRNPVPIEHLRHLASQTMARARMMLDIVHNTPFTDMNDSEGETQVTGLVTFETAARVLDLMTALLPALTVDGTRVAENIRRSCATVTELADSLVRIEGLSFRQAHEIAAKVARAVVAARGSIGEDGFTPFQAAFAETAGRASKINPAEFAHIVSAEYFVAVRDRPGGPAPAALREAIANYRRQLGALAHAAEAGARHETTAADLLKMKFRQLSEGSIMARIELTGVVKRFGKVEVVHGIDLTVADGEFVVLVGPSGCGKSTTLRMVAGLEEITSGTIAIDGRVVNQVEPKDRDIAMVFQNYAIYPHMTVAKNIGFGLYTSKLPAQEKQARILEAAKTLGLEELLDRRPSQLSGGQRQRVAIGRAMVRQPAVFLFDEPLSNLDAQLRSQMRVEIKKLHQRLGTTIVFVTHDQVEAMTMADRIVVMHAGRILQAGAPMEVYERPNDVFTARFIGSPTMNILKARLSGANGSRSLAFDTPGVEAEARSETLARSRNPDILVGVRPQDLRLVEGEGPAGITVAGKVSVIEPLGAETFVHIEAGGETLVATTSGRSAPRVGTTVRACARMRRYATLTASRKNRCDDAVPCGRLDSLRAPAGRTKVCQSR